MTYPCCRHCAPSNPHHPAAGEHATPCGCERQEPEHVRHMHTTTRCPTCHLDGWLCRDDGVQRLDWHGARRRVEIARNPKCPACVANLATLPLVQLDLFSAVAS